jgi:hypothetical protein
MPCDQCHSQHVRECLKTVLHACCTRCCLATMIVCLFCAGMALSSVLLIAGVDLAKADWHGATLHASDAVLCGAVSTVLL